MQSFTQQKKLLSDEHQRTHLGKMIASTAQMWDNAPLTLEAGIVQLYEERARYENEWSTDLLR